jgi:hypothetical protein
MVLKQCTKLGKIAEAQGGNCPKQTKNENPLANRKLRIVLASKRKPERKAKHKGAIARNKNNKNPLANRKLRIVLASKRKPERKAKHKGAIARNKNNKNPLANRKLRLVFASKKKLELKAKHKGTNADRPDRPTDRPAGEGNSVDLT